MSSPAVAQLRFINQIPVDTARTAVTTFTNWRPGILRPDLAGCKVRVTGKTPIYVIDSRGYRRLVPFPLTFMNLFKDHAVFQDVLVSDGISDIAEGPALDDGAILVRGMYSEDIFLMDKGRKRPISTAKIMDKYGFDEASVIVAPQILVDSLPMGEVWE